jgi:hypothetical protein
MGRARAFNRAVWFAPRPTIPNVTNWELANWELAVTIVDWAPARTVTNAAQATINAQQTMKSGFISRPPGSIVRLLDLYKPGGRAVVAPD